MWMLSLTFLAYVAFGVWESQKPNYSRPPGDREAGRYRRRSLSGAAAGPKK
jgi:hypothetical protein